MGSERAAIVLGVTAVIAGCGAPPAPNHARPVISDAALVLAAPAPTILIEAARATAFEPGSGALADKQWRIVPDANASHGRAIEAWPNTGAGVTDSTDGPRLDYAVRFSEPGTYFVWARLLGATGDDDSIHVGLDGVPASFGGLGLSGPDHGEWAWVNTVWDRPEPSRVTVHVDSATTHVLNLWMREDGVKVDALEVTRDPALDPAAI